MKHIHYVIVIICVSCYTTAVAQQEWGDGEIKDVEIEIVKDRLIILPHASRLFDKIPPRPVEPVKPEIAYTFKAFNFSTPEINPLIRPLRLKQPDPEQTYRGYISLGYGNYASPFLDAFVTNAHDKKKLVGAHAYLNRSAKGPIDGKNSGGGTTGASAFIQTYSKAISFRGNIGVENRNTHFYGYPDSLTVERDSIRQSFMLFNLGLSLANAKNSDFSYAVGGNFSYLKDDFHASESMVDLNAKSSYSLADDQFVDLRADFSVISRSDKGINAKPRNLFQVNGFYSFKSKSNFTLHVGATVALENDTLDKKDFHFYPDIKITYPLNDWIDFVGAVTGGMEKISLQSLANENSWVAPAVALNHTNKTFDLQAGIRAKLGENILVGAGVSVASLKNLYFFVNDTTDASRFQVAYDNGATKRANLYASLVVTHADVMKVSLQGDYFAYGTDKIKNAYHKPGYRMVAGVSYNLFKKFIFNLDAVAQGNVKALDPVTNKTISLDNAFDLNFKTEYLVSDTFSAFLELNNIVGKKYPVFLNYPVRGFQAMAGITWKF